MELLSNLPLPNTWHVVGATVAYILYRLGTSSFTYFSDQGIPGPKPIPFLGNLWGIWKENIPRYDLELVKKYGKYVGLFDGRQPNLFVTDPELIRSVCVKEFDHFINRRNMDIKAKVVRMMLTLICDQQWKNVRSSISPTFTTGKIKMMSPLIKERADRLAMKFKELAQQNGKIDAKMQLSTYTMDVIARCAFGMNIENLGGTEDQFMKNASLVFNGPVQKSPLILLPFVFPELVALLGDDALVTKEIRFFISLLENVVRERSISNEKYHDFIEVATKTIVESVREHKDVDGPQWTREEVDEIVIAQSVLFLLAGFDTTATTLTNAFYLLANNQEIQEKLYQMIAQRTEEFGDISHEFVLNMPYLDQVVNEVLRLLPPLLRVERVCNKDITCKGIRIKKGSVVTVPVYALHHMEEYYPDPDKFDPDRWSAERKSEIQNYTFMPFGLGPRNCVGMRFALEEIKITLCTIVKQFRFFPVEETPDHLMLENGFLLISQPRHAIIGIETRDGMNLAV